MRQPPPGLIPERTSCPPHRWRISTPDGPLSPGYCVYCGAEDDFKNSYGYDDSWREQADTTAKALLRGAL